MKPRIVLSGVNFVEGGPLSVFQDALRELSASFADRYTLTALVHRSELFDVPGVEYLEFPQVKSSWLRRLRFEYIECRALSVRLQPHLWLSMHDITPSVTARTRAVYCHNPAPFYRMPLGEVMLDRTFTLFRLLYRFLYGINIRKNDFVIVQQDWMRGEFRRRYGVREVVVAHPSLPEPVLQAAGPAQANVFFYPALARSFKNIEGLLRAAAMLEGEGAPPFEVWLTISGQENKYAAMLLREFGHLQSVRWLGLQPRSHVEELYAAAGCMVFPSRLESWGMPISEWKRTGKPMIVADLPYAHETTGGYDAVRFVAPLDVAEICAAMRGFLQGDLQVSPVRAAAIPQPFAANWYELFCILLGEGDRPGVARERTEMGRVEASGELVLPAAGNC